MSNTTQPNDFNFNTLDNVTFSFQSKLSKLQNVQIIKSLEATNKELTWQVWLLSHFISKGHWDPTAPLPIPGNMDLSVLYATDRLMILWCTSGATDHAVPVCTNQGDDNAPAFLTGTELELSWLVSSKMSRHSQSSRKVSNPKTQLGFLGQRYSIRVTVICCQRE